MDGAEKLAVQFHHHCQCLKREKAIALIAGLAVNCQAYAHFLNLRIISLIAQFMMSGH